jgi:hypothetical protein
MVLLRRSRRARLPVLTGLGLASAAVTVASAARATDPFEIQVYDGTANAPGVPGLELHTNYVASGGTPPPAPEISLVGQTHLTLEPSLGVLPFWEIGGYFQTAIRKDGTFDYAGVKVRSKFVTPPGWHPHLRLGMNFEMSMLPPEYDGDRLGAEIRPIVAWENASWEFVINPILDLELTYPAWHTGPTFEPAASAVYKIREVVSAGLEYYSNLGPIGSGFVPLQQQEQYVFEVVNLIGIKRVEVNAGVGEGLTQASHGLVVKMILGYTWEREEREERSVTRTRVGPRFW